MFATSHSFFNYFSLIFQISIVQWLNCRNLKYELNRSYNGGGVVYLRKSEASHSSLQYAKRRLPEGRGDTTRLLKSGGWRQFRAHADRGGGGSESSSSRWGPLGVANFSWVGQLCRTQSSPRFKKRNDLFPLVSQPPVEAGEFLWFPLRLFWEHGDYCERRSESRPNIEEMRAQIKRRNLASNSNLGYHII